MDNSSAFLFKKMLIRSKALPLTHDFKISRKKQKIFILATSLEFLLALCVVPTYLSGQYDSVSRMDTYFIFISPVIWLAITYPTIITYYVECVLLISIFNKIFDVISRYNYAEHIHYTFFKLFLKTVIKFLIFLVYTLVVVVFNFFDNGIEWCGAIMLPLYTSMLIKCYFCIDIYAVLIDTDAILLSESDRIVRYNTEGSNLNFMNRFLTEISNIVDTYTDIIDIFSFKVSLLSIAAAFFVFGNCNLCLVRLFDIFIVRKCYGIVPCWRLWFRLALTAILWLVLSMAFILFIFTGPVEAAKQV